MKFDLDIDKIEYLKILLKKDNNYFLQKAMINTITDTELVASFSVTEKFNIEYPQNVRLSIVAVNGMYYADTILKAARKEISSYLIFLQKPKEIEYRQKRDFFRINSKETAILKFNGKIIDCFTENVSASGVCLRLSSQIEIPDEVYLELYFKDIRICTKAKLIRVERCNVREVLAAFTFVNMSTQDEDLISKFCIQKQLELKRQDTYKKMY